MGSGPWCRAPDDAPSSSPFITAHAAAPCYVGERPVTTCTVRMALKSSSCLLIVITPHHHHHQPPDSPHRILLHPASCCCPTPPRSCSWMSPPTTWTCARCCGWRGTSIYGPPPPGPMAPHHQPPCSLLPILLQPAPHSAAPCPSICCTPLPILLHPAPHSAAPCPSFCCTLPLNLLPRPHPPSRPCPHTCAACQMPPLKCGPGAHFPPSKTVYNNIEIVSKNSNRSI